MVLLLFFSAVILFVVENVTYNICDQRFHEFEIRRQNPTVTVVRRTLTQIAEIAKLGKNKELTMYVVHFLLNTVFLI
jgi:glutathione synthase